MVLGLLVRRALLELEGIYKMKWHSQNPVAILIPTKIQGIIARNIYQATKSIGMAIRIAKVIANTIKSILNMPPCFSFKNSSYTFSRDSKFSSQWPPTNPTSFRFVKFSNFKNFFFCQFYIPAILSMFHSSFSRSINHIFSLCSDKKMFRVNAWWVITSMAYKFSFWNRSIMNNPRNSIGNIGSKCSISPISSDILTSSPKPTIRRFFYVSPKSNNWVFPTITTLMRSFFTKRFKAIFALPIRFIDRIVLHWKLIFSDAIPRKVIALAGILLTLSIPLLSGLSIADTITTRAGIIKPDISSTGWGLKINSDMDIIDSSACYQGVSNTFTSTNTFSGPIVLSGSNPIRFYDATTHYLSFKAPTTVTTTTFTWPTSDGSSNQVLQTNGSGALSWSTPGGASALLSTTNTWTATQAFNSNITFNNEVDVSNGAGTSGYVLQSQGSASPPVWVAGTALPAGNTNYIQNSNVLQANSTFYVLTGTVSTNLYASSITVNNSSLFNTVAAFNGSGVLVSTTISGTGIQNTSTLQSGATFYVSSGTINGPLSITGVDSGNNGIKITGAGGTSPQISITNPANSPATSSLRLQAAATSGQLQQNGSFPLQLATNGQVRVAISTFSPIINIPDLTASQFVKTDTSKNLISSTLSSGDLPGGNTSYIQNTQTLQSGATFYVSSGTVAGQFNIGNSAFIQLNGSGLSAYTAPIPSVFPIGGILLTNTSVLGSQSSGVNFLKNDLVTPTVGFSNSSSLELLFSSGTINFNDGNSNPSLRKSVSLASAGSNFVNHTMVLPSSTTVSTNSFINVGSISGTTENLQYYDLFNASPTFTSGVTISSANVTGQLTAGTLQGASLAACGDSSHALSWSGGSFGCQSITGSAGVSLSSTNTWTAGQTYISSSTFNGSIVISTTISAGPTALGVVISTNIVFSTSTEGIVGVTNGTYPSVGIVGERVESIYSSVSAAGNNIFTDGSSISLTPGDWQIFHQITCNRNEVANVGYCQNGISVHSGNDGTDLIYGDTSLYFAYPVSATSDMFSMTVAISTTTRTTQTFYAKIVSGFAGVTPTFSGKIVARRAH